MEPVGTCLAISAYWAIPSDNGSQKADTSMPDCESYLPPEDCEGEVPTFLTSFVYQWVLVAMVIINVLFNQKSKNTLPRSEYCIVEHWQPVWEENLPTKSICECEVYLSEHQDDVLVKVVANHLGNAVVTPPAMYEQEFHQVSELRY